MKDSRPLSFKPVEISDASENDSMKDFIVDDEEGEKSGQEKSEDESEDENHLQEKKQTMASKLLDYHIPSCKIDISWKTVVAIL